MPTYDYHCVDNGQTVEVNHRMSEKMLTWGELCERAGIEPGQTPPGSEVERQATGGQVVKSSSLGNSDMPPCSVGGGCPSGGCGLH